MKFHWFAEATYPDLPPQFATEGSSWVDSSRAHADPAKQGKALNGFLTMYEHAAKVGFDGLAVHPSARGQAALAARRVRRRLRRVLPGRAVLQALRRRSSARRP